MNKSKELYGVFNALAAFMVYHLNWSIRRSICKKKGFKMKLIIHDMEDTLMDVKFEDAK